MEESNVFDSRWAANQIRIAIIKMAHAAQASHVGSALSCVDILTVLYHNHLVGNQNSKQVPEGKLIFSKGHAAMALYATLAKYGYLEESILQTYGQDNTILSGHASHLANDEIVLSTGSLGHGLPYAIGIALAQKRKGSTDQVYVILSDGELDEGTTWESALIAAQLELDNLIVIVDRNHIQSLGPTELTLALEPLSEKWKSFRWDVECVNGHNHDQLKESLKKTKMPKCVIAETTKGYGVDFMENSVLWHYRPPSDTELHEALRQLSGIPK